MALLLCAAIAACAIAGVAGLSIDVPDVPFEVIFPESEIEKHHIQTTPYLIWDGKLPPRFSELSQPTESS